MLRSTTNRGHDRTVGLIQQMEKRIQNALQQSSTFDIADDHPDHAWIRYNVKAFPRFNERVALNSAYLNEPIGDILERRKSFRDFDLTQHLSFGALSTALASATHTTFGDGIHRPYPSAGARLSAEVYLLSLNIDELPDGVWYLDCSAKELICLFSFNFRPTLSRALGDAGFGAAPAYLVYTSLPYRMLVKYGVRGYRYATIEIGALAQTVDIAATAVGLKTLWIGGFDEAEIARILGLNMSLECEYPTLIQAIQ